MWSSRKCDFIAPIAILFVLASFLSILTRVDGLGEIIFAVNCGGDSLIDSHGIRYRKDYLTDGIASDYGRILDIKRVSAQDKPLYQHERYAPETFGYTISMAEAGDGDYVLWLKFSEVWFNGPNQKIFDVALNDVTVISMLDIFAKVGRATAHDEVVPFHVRGNKLVVNGKSLPFDDKQIRVDFVKGANDNPKINALVVMRGTPEQVPELMPYEPKQQVNEFEDDVDDEDFEARLNRNENDENVDDEIDDLEQQRRLKRKSLMNNNEETYGEDDEQDATKRRSNRQANRQEETVIDDPYASDDSSYVIPVLVAVGAFIPLLFCLCRL